MNQAIVVNMPIHLVCTVHWVSVCSGSPGDDKGIANLLVRGSGRQFAIPLCNFLGPVSPGVLYPAGVHPSVSMIS